MVKDISLIGISSIFFLALANCETPVAATDPTENSEMTDTPTETSEEDETNDTEVTNDVVEAEETNPDNATIQPSTPTILSPPVTPTQTPTPTQVMQTSDLIGASATAVVCGTGGTNVVTVGTGGQYATIQAAINNAPSGALIKVLQGNYAESLIIPAGKNFYLQGGFTSGFLSRDPFKTLSTITPANGNGITVTNPGTVTIDGFRIANAVHGIESSSDEPGIGSMILCNNILENNSKLRGYEDSGGGLLIDGPNVTVRNNVIRGNSAGRGGGAAISSPAIAFENNTVENNTGYGDHGGGLSIIGKGTIQKNIIHGNKIAMDYGWGGGIIILNSGTNIRFYSNIVSDNTAPSLGAGIFVDEGAFARIEHSFIIRNKTLEQNGGAGIYIDGADSTVGSEATITNCTVADNTDASTGKGNGVYVEGHSRATVSRSIFWNNRNGESVYDDFYSRRENGDDDSSLTINQSASSEMVTTDAEKGIVADSLNFSKVNPQFANPTDGDYRPLSADPRFSGLGAYSCVTGSIVVDEPVE